MGGQEYIVPALSWGFIRRNDKLLERMQKAESKKEITPQMADDLLTLVHAALKRNYPDITIEQLEDMMDLRNIREIFPAIMAESGFVKAEEDSAGE